jgi:hypothetical protein
MSKQDADVLLMDTEALGMTYACCAICESWLVEFSNTSTVGAGCACI